MPGLTPYTAVQARILSALAQDLGQPLNRIAAAVALMDDGATVPFIARYRKEATGGLDDTVLRELEQRLSYRRDLEARRMAIVESIASQGKLTESLRLALEACDNKQGLEDLYAPYKPKRRSRAQIAREAGLEGLAEAILNDRNIDPLIEAAGWINAEAGFADAKAALDGARDILAERWAEDVRVLERLRRLMWDSGWLYSKVLEGKQTEGANFRDWFDFAEPIRKIPSHRALAMLRGRQQGILDLKLGLEQEREAQVPHPCVPMIADILGIAAGFSPQDGAQPRWLAEVCRWTWRVKLLPGFEAELIGQLREQAEAEAIRVFATNLRHLLLAAPAGPRVVMGLDPGIRTGVKVAIIDATGKLLDTATVYPHEPRRDWDGAIETLAHLARRHGVTLVGIGNGTASRETDKLVADLMRRHTSLGLQRVTVSEAGASVYSASELAAAEFPDLDVSLRGAVSIARRLQDPLAELVKIDPRSIGVGQYQHDVDQRALARSLEAVVEDCVNAVGVDVNTASPALLSRVSGLGPALARGIVQWRNLHGPFPNRQALRAVPRLGDKVFEQAAGFLRIPQGDNPLDRSAVHPESYPVVKRILDRIGKDVSEVLGQSELLRRVNAEEFVDERFGLPTVLDILAELEKPGRDPRPEFKAARFDEAVQTLADLREGMVLEGVVTNVANFGAFVDIGVHQDGLVHVSCLADRFVKDPHEVVKVGQTVQVKVLDVDRDRERIALSMRLSDEPGARPSGSVSASPGKAHGARSDKARHERVVPAGAMAEAFAKLRQR
jgi:uncharacterized protein